MILLEQVGFTYADGAVGLQDVSFAVPTGELVVVAGANGSGKTTLLKHLNGLLLPQRGRVAVDGVCTRDDPHGVRQRVGMVFQHADAQIVGETVADDVAFGPENLLLSRPEIEARVADALDAVGLPLSGLAILFGVDRIPDMFEQVACRRRLAAPRQPGNGRLHHGVIALDERSRLKEVVRQPLLLPGLLRDFNQRRAAEAGVDIDLGYTIPREGAIDWYDVMYIPADAPHPDASTGAATWSATCPTATSAVSTRMAI